MTDDQTGEKFVYLLYHSHLFGWDFVMLKVVTEGPKAYHTDDNVHRRLRKSDPNVFADGMEAASRYFQLVDEEKAKMAKRIERMDRVVAKLLKAVEERKQRMELESAGTLTPKNSGF